MLNPDCIRGPSRRIAAVAVTALLLAAPSLAGDAPRGGGGKTIELWRSPPPA